MPAEVVLTRVRFDMEDMPVAIKNVHIGEGGEARNVEFRYDEVKRQLHLEVYELGGTEVLQKFRFMNGKILVANDRGAFVGIAGLYPF